jgi:cytochrome c553
MRSFVSKVILALTSVLAAAVLIAADPPPPWAYGFAGPPPATPPAAAPAPAGGGGGRGAGAAAPAPDESKKTLPGSTGSFTLAQIRDAFGPADWYPGDHPPMPEIVAKGKRPDVRACSLCHYPNGKGRPENAGVSGLPVSYFIQTMNDFRNDARKSADARKANTNVMITIAKGMTDDEIKASAEYFGAMKWTPWIKVVETNTVPKTRIAGGMFLRLEPEEKEPIGQRIIETPDDTEGTEALRNPRSGFTAYVPVGSLKNGDALVNTGAGGKTTQCAVCHGADLRGMGPVP